MHVTRIVVSAITKYRLPEIISKYSQKKPMMIFCITRNATVTTAKLLANLWATKGARDRPWPGPRQKIAAKDPELRSTLNFLFVLTCSNPSQILWPLPSRSTMLALKLQIGMP